MNDTDAQKKEIEKIDEQLEDLTPEKGATGGLRVPKRPNDFADSGTSLEAQKKEINEV